MITIHNKFTRDFTGIGSNLLYPDSCTVQEELNGMFEMTLTHPYDVQGRWKGLQLQNIIVAPTPLGNQPLEYIKPFSILKVLQFMPNTYFMTCLTIWQKNLK